VRYRWRIGPVSGITRIPPHRDIPRIAGSARARDVRITVVAAIALAPPRPSWPPLTSIRPSSRCAGSWAAGKAAIPAQHSTGDFTLAPDLGGKVLVRRSRNDGPQGHHEDLMIVFAGPGGLRASYYDTKVT